MTVKEIMTVLAEKGSDSIKKVLLKHGVKEPCFGVRIEELKKIQQKLKINYQLAKDLYATGNADAMYLAGLIADDSKMTKKDLQLWVENAHSDNISGYTVPWVAAGSLHGFALAMKWIQSGKTHIAAAGWSTLGNLVALQADSDLDMAQLKKLLQAVEKEINQAPYRVRQSMNGFVIAVGSYVAGLTDMAMATAEKYSLAQMDRKDTACKIPSATAYLQKVQAKGRIGKKKKTVKC